MTKSEFFLWIAFIHTAPDYIVSLNGTPITEYKDYSWKNYCLDCFDHNIDEYWMWMLEYKLQFGQTTQEMIDIINSKSGN